ncbi:protein kinase, partial [Nocardia sp. NPDC050710]|uniref:serine/threonine-protein kinase n=1 Tax=Nocardia sp. NPDC050710 TaxID=3157220 RepID=UPI0033CB0D40
MGDARFGRYRLERLLGKGGMGQVWLAHDTDAERRVALKLLPAELAADAGYRTRFEREAELAAALRDPHIVPIHRHGEIDGRLFIEMEFIEGTELAARLAAGGPMDAHAAVEILGQIASALDTAHRAGLVHRDVKPSNILVRPSGFAYLIDFGIARSAGQTAVTATGLAIGTWAYMAPERFSGKSDARSDVYSLACVLYECLTGRRPHGDTDPAQQMHGHLMIDPPRAVTLNPAIPAELDQVIARGMAKNPADRHPSAGAFARAAATALPPTPNHGAPRQRPRRIASSDRTPAPNPRPPIDTPGASHDHVAAPPVPAATKMLTDPGPTPTRVETSASAGRVPGPDQQVSSGDPAGSIGRVPDAVAGRPPVPTKMLTEPGPTPTRVETSASAGRVPGPDQQVSSGDPAGS